MNKTIAKRESRAKPPNMRDQAIAALSRMPANSSFEDLQYRLYVLEKIRKAEKSYEENGGMSHAEAKRRMQKWLGK